MIQSVLPCEAYEYNSTPPATEFVNCKYGYAEISKTDDGYKMVRLISTDPKAYLDGNYLPYSKINRDTF